MIEFIKRLKKIAHNKRYRELHREQIAEYRRKWKKNNPKKVKAEKKRYREKNPKKVKEWKKNNPEKVKEHRKREKKHTDNPEEKRKHAERQKLYRKANHEKIKIGKKKWRNENPEIWKKLKLKRKKMGFIQLNEWFIGSHAHHINKDEVVYIPEQIHRDHPHSLKKPETMIDINKIAEKFIIPFRFPQAPS